MFAEPIRLAWSARKSLGALQEQLKQVCRLYPRRVSAEELTIFCREDRLSERFFRQKTVCSSLEAEPNVSVC